jgi:hypothetical protein
MIDADYHMKKVSQGLVRVKAVPSVLDIRAGRTRADTEKAVSSSLCRFYFELAEGDPEILVTEYCAWLRSCRVVVRARKQALDADENPYDLPSQDPAAMLFAERFSRQIPSLAGKIESYSNLLKMYRLNALIGTLAARGLASGYLAVLWRDYSPCAEEAMPLYVNPKGNATVVSLEDRKALLTVVGGVNMRVRIGRENLSKPHGAVKASMKEVGNTAIDERPADNTVWWPIRASADRTKALG